VNCTKIPGKDKGCHFIAGFIIALIASVIVGGLVGFGIAVLAGVLKEAYDQYKYRGADFVDLFATVAGGAVGMFAFQVLHKFFEINPLYLIGF